MLRRSFLISSALLACANAFATQKYIEKDGEFKILGTPYIVGGGTSCANIVFAANKISLADIYISSQQDPDFKEPKAFFQSSTTGKKHAGTIHNVRVYGLKAGMRYTVKIVAKELVQYWNWKWKKGEGYGEIYLGKIIELTKNPDGGEIAFTTTSAKNKVLKFAVLNDTHERPKVINSLMDALPKDYEFLIMNGDMLDYIGDERKLFRNLVDPVAKNLNCQKPVYFLRGNHETRGKQAEDFYTYFPTKSGKTYYAFRAGPVFFLCLDLCEDKPDDSWEGRFLNDFTHYRNAEFKWVKDVVNSPAFKEAKCRIVVQHIPPAIDYMAYRTKNDTHFDSLLKDKNINLMLCAHMHKYYYVPANTDQMEIYEDGKYKSKIANENKTLPFPIIVNSNNESMYVSVENEIKVDFYGQNGNKSRESLTFKL